MSLFSLLVSLKRPFETLFEIPRSCCLYTIFFCKPNLKKCNFFWKAPVYRFWRKHLRALHKTW
jgi:hypothetical protein